MDAKTQSKIRNAVKKIHADMESDPEVRKQVAQNHIRVLAERGGLSLPEIIAAHDLWCEGTTGACPQALTMSLKLNGAIKQRTILTDMVTDVRGLIAYASRFAALKPGDMIFTGTPAGVGPIADGDVIAAEVDAIGRMQVTVRNYVPQ